MFPERHVPRIPSPVDVDESARPDGGTELETTAHPQDVLAQPSTDRRANGTWQGSTRSHTGATNTGKGIGGFPLCASECNFIFFSLCSYSLTSSLFFFPFLFPFSSLLALNQRNKKKIPIRKHFLFFYFRGNRAKFFSPFGISPSCWVFFMRCWSTC